MTSVASTVARGVGSHAARNGGSRVDRVAADLDARDPGAHRVRSGPTAARPCARSCRCSVEVEHDASGAAVAHEPECLLDRVERQPRGDQPVEREPAAAVEVEQRREVALRAARSRRREPSTRRSIRGIESAGSDSSASAAGIPISTAAPRARVDRNAARAASVRPVASIA